MNTNEKIVNQKIAEWLKVISHIYGEYEVLYYYKNYHPVTKLDFIHDRNQQKWIEDKLIELGYRIDYCFEEKGTHWEIIIAKEENANWYDLDYIDNTIYIGIKNESKDLAFIQAIEQLIDKENESTKKI